MPSSSIQMMNGLLKLVIVGNCVMTYTLLIVRQISCVMTFTLVIIRLSLSGILNEVNILR